MDAIALWLLRNWKLAVVGIAVALIMGYIAFIKVELGHYKKKYADEHSQFVLYKSGAEAKQAKLEAGAEALSARHEHTLAVLDAELAKSAKLTQEKIEANEELKRTRVSLAAVRLLNESTRATEEPTPAVEANAGSPAGTEADSVSLALVFGVVAENNKNHLACTERLSEWVTFWTEYTAVVKDAQDASP